MYKIINHTYFHTSLSSIWTIFYSLELEHRNRWEASVVVYLMTAGFPFSAALLFFIELKSLGSSAFTFTLLGAWPVFHLFCGGFADVFHKALCITTASIDTDKCFVDVTSLKLFPPELYLQSKHASFILLTSKYTPSSKPLGDVIIQFKDMST